MYESLPAIAVEPGRHACDAHDLLSDSQKALTLCFIPTSSPKPEGPGGGSASLDKPTAVCEASEAYYFILSV